MDSDPLKPTRRLALSGFALLVATVAGISAARLLARGSDNLALGVLVAGAALAGLGAGAALLVAAAVTGVATLAREPATRRLLAYVLVAGALVIGGALAGRLLFLSLLP